MMSKEEAAAVPFQFNSKYAGTSYFDGRSLSELGTRDEDYWIEESMDHSGESLFFSDIMHFSETGELETGTAWNYDSVLPYMTQRWESQTQAETEGYSSYLYSVTPNRYTASATANIMYHNKPSGESDNGYHRVLVKAGEGQTDLCGYEADGVMAIQAAFSDAGWFSEGLAAVKREGAGWGYIDEKGAVRIPFGLQSAGPFVNGLAPVSFKDGSETVHCGYIDRDGKLVYLLADELSSKITEACRWREYLCLGPADEKGEFYIGYRSFRTGDVNSVNEAWGGIDGIAKNMDSSEEILSWLEEYVASVMQDAIERDVAFSGFLFKVKGVLEYRSPDTGRKRDRHIAKTCGGAAGTVERLYRNGGICRSRLDDHFMDGVVGRYKIRSGCRRKLYLSHGKRTLDESMHTGGR